MVVDAPADATPNTELNEVFRKKLANEAEHIPTKERLLVLVDANARIGRRMEGGGDGRVL